MLLRINSVSLARSILFQPHENDKKRVWLTKNEFVLGVLTKNEMELSGTAPECRTKYCPEGQTGRQDLNLHLPVNRWVFYR